MLTQAEITAYAVAMRRAEEDAAARYSEQWERLRKWQFARPQVKCFDVAAWQREYEEETGTLLGCD
jgi:hypothetical protein